MDCLNLKDLTQLFETVDFMLAGTNNPQGFQFIGDFSLFILEVNFSVIQFVNPNCKLVIEETPSKTESSQIIRIIQPTIVYYEILSNAFLLCVLLKKVIFMVIIGTRPHPHPFYCRKGIQRGL